MHIGLHNLFEKRNAESRSVNAENPKREKAGGARATDVTSLHRASVRWGRQLGVGWKASPCIPLKAHIRHSR